MVKKSWIELANERGYEQVKIYWPEQGDKDGVINWPKEKPHKIWLNKETGCWFEDLEDLFEYEGEWPDD